MGELIVTGILLGGLYGFISIGLNLIFGVMRIVNFANGEFIMVSMYLSFWAFHFYGIDPYISILVITPLSFLFFSTIAKPFILKLARASHLGQTFITFGIGILLQNLALMFFSADFRSVETPYSKMQISITNDINISFPRLVVFITAIVLTVGLYYYLKNSYTGKSIRATMQNKNVSMLMGIDIDKVYVFTFSLGVSISVLAGGLLLPIFYVYPTIGFNFALLGFVVVVLGGLGSIPGTLIGGLIIGLTEAFSGYFISTSMKQLIYFGIFILVLAFKPAGLFGQRGTEELGVK
jgi:branched-chain amino acid transport system permease protein